MTQPTTRSATTQDHIDQPDFSPGATPGGFSAGAAGKIGLCGTLEFRDAAGAVVKTIDVNLPLFTMPAAEAVALAQELSNGPYHRE